MSRLPHIAILHYTGPPVIGGVEAVIQAHMRAFINSGYPVTLIVGRGERSALPRGNKLITIPEIDSRHPEILAIGEALEAGIVPQSFAPMVERLVNVLRTHLPKFDFLIIHNIFTKHFNIPLTNALHHLIDQGIIRHAIAWCHDFTWTSPSSGHKVYPGDPWELLKRYREDTTYVTISEERRKTLAEMLNCPSQHIQCVYNGVDPKRLLGLSDEGEALITRLGVYESDLVLLMPVRVTQAKNIEYALNVLAGLKTYFHKPRLILTGPPDPHDSSSLEYFRSLKSLRDHLGLKEDMCFVYESGPNAEDAYQIDETIVGELLRVSDIVFMPSHREGFGMPVLEAGLAGIPVVSTGIPASIEIGGQDVHIFGLDMSASELAGEILALVKNNPQYNLRSRVRRSYTWQAIFRNQIEPMLALSPRES